MSGNRAFPGRLRRASRATRRADRRLVTNAKAFNRCVRRHRAHPRRCGGIRQSVQRSGSGLAGAETQLSKVATQTGATAASSAGGHGGGEQLAPPAVTVSGATLHWKAVAGLQTYVLLIRVPGQPDRFTIVTGTSVTPPPVPGVTVGYFVRTTALSSQWSAEVTIAYPAERPSSDPQAAPVLTVSGQTLSWQAVAGIGTYVLVRKAPGHADEYSVVGGTSVTPPADPGATVRYSVRTAVEGSAWAPEVSITYPAPGSPPPSSPPAPTGGGGEGGGEGALNMRVALDIGGWVWASAINDEAGAVKYVRSSYKHFDSDAQMELLAKAGVTLMPLFGEGGTLAEYDNATFFNEIVAWFKRYGRGGTFWAGKPVDLGATTAELINEPGNPYFYPDYANTQLYASMTQAVHSALEANFAPSVRPKLLVSYDGGFSGSSYGRAIFAAGAVADGVTVHPYGGHGSESALGGRERVTQAHSETGLPVYVTEIGWPTALGQPATGDSLQWSEQQQAENLTNFISWARSLGYVADVTYFNYADYGTNDWYGIVNSSGTVHKLSYNALKAAAG